MYRRTERAAHGTVVGAQHHREEQHALAGRQLVGSFQHFRKFGIGYGQKVEGSTAAAATVAELNLPLDLLLQEESGLCRRCLGLRVFELDALCNTVPDKDDTEVLCVGQAYRQADAHKCENRFFHHGYSFLSFRYLLFRRTTAGSKPLPDTVSVMSPGCSCVRTMTTS